MGGVGRDLKNHLLPTPAMGTPPAVPGGSSPALDIPRDGESPFLRATNAEPTRKSQNPTDPQVPPFPKKVWERKRRIL